jgi:hypothetical protein
VNRTLLPLEYRSSVASYVAPPSLK